jgi:lipopolysaccharide assembly protein A
MSEPRNHPEPGVVHEAPPPARTAPPPGTPSPEEDITRYVPASQGMPPAPEAPPAPDPDRVPTGSTTVPRSVPRSRTGGVWIAVTISAVILLLLLIFILENNDSVDVGFFGQHSHLPLGVALLLAAVFGVLLVAIPGYGRIIQLRRAATHPDSRTRPRRLGNRRRAQR